MSPIVPPWNARTAGTFHPRLVLRSSAAPAETLAAVANGLTAAGFKVTSTGTETAVAKYFGWKWALAGVLTGSDFPLALAKLKITATAGAATAKVVSEHGGKEAGKHAADGLSRAVIDLRSRGFEITVGEWGR